MEAWTAQGLYEHLDSSDCGKGLKNADILSKLGFMFIWFVNGLNIVTISVECLLILTC